MDEEELIILNKNVEFLQVSIKTEEARRTIALILFHSYSRVCKHVKVWGHNTVNYLSSLGNTSQ